MKRSAFTLVEIALALAVLLVGLTAVTSVYLTGLRWGGEVRHGMSVMRYVHDVANDPRLLTESPGAEPVGDAGTIPSSGWYNGYYFVRARQEVAPEDWPILSGGTRYETLISVYAGEWFDGVSAADLTLIRRYPVSEIER
ncbi:MAG: hypothetical protein ACOCXA_01845 [Planctomycetota bacterium]